MASATGPGQNPLARLPHSSSTQSTRARASARYADRPRLAVEAFKDLFDLELGAGELFPCRPQALDTFLEQAQRLIEVQVLRLELPHDLFQPRELRREVLLLAHQRRSTRAGTSPSERRSRNARPGESCSTRSRT